MERNLIPRNATCSLGSSTLNETFLSAVCDSFALCLLFCFSPLYLFLLFWFLSSFLLVVVALTHRGERSQRTRTRGFNGRCNFFLASFQFFSPLDFSVFNFLFFCLCVFHPPTRCWRCHNADLKHLFCIFVRVGSSFLRVFLKLCYGFFLKYFQIFSLVFLNDFSRISFKNISTSFIDAKT